MPVNMVVSEKNICKNFIFNPFSQFLKLENINVSAFDFKSHRQVQKERTLSFKTIKSTLHKNTTLCHVFLIKISSYSSATTGFISWASITVAVWEAQMLQSATVHVAKCDNPACVLRTPWCAGNAVCTDVLIHTCWGILQCETMLSLLKLSIASLITNAGALVVLLRKRSQAGMTEVAVLLSKVEA